jgi:hypothetical protein
VRAAKPYLFLAGPGEGDVSGIWRHLHKVLGKFEQQITTEPVIKSSGSDEASGQYSVLTHKCGAL